ncbi:exodeoxyribonuclease VII large subunit, partial [Lactobacillus nasalidis]
AADCRAATPTAAAEMATPDLTQTVAEIGQLQTRLLTGIRVAIQTRAQALAQVANSFIMKEPQRLYEQKAQQVDQLTQQLSRVMEVTVRDQRQKLSLLAQRLQHQAPDRKIKQLQQENSFLAKSLQAQMQRQLEQKQAACGRLVQQ